MENVKLRFFNENIVKINYRILFGPRRFSAIDVKGGKMEFINFCKLSHCKVADFEHCFVINLYLDQILN